jgi:predicted kinase
LTVPHLIVINGLPGSGKTTLFRRLVQGLQIPGFARDGIYETLFDAMDCAESGSPLMLGHGAFGMLYYSAGQLLSVGQPVIMEAFFGRPELRSAEFRQLQKRYPFEPIQLLCKADGNVLVDRFLERMTSEGRHLGHQDQAWIEKNRSRLLQGKLEPLSIGGTLIEVDTTASKQKVYDELIVQILSLLNVRKPEGNK